MLHRTLILFVFICLFYGNIATSGLIKASALEGNCAVILPKPARKISYTGSCINGLADGWGEVNVFFGDFGRVNYQGYFQQGYAIKTQYNGYFLQNKQQKVYFYTKQDFADIALQATSTDNNIVCNICSGNLMVVSKKSNQKNI